MVSSSRFLAFLQGLCTLGAVWFIFSFIAVALLSINYPYHLEWMEGQSIDVIGRILDGKSIYVEPTIVYVPFIYPPLYFYVSAVVAKLVGIDFFAARLVSLLSVVGTGVLLYGWVRREGGDKKTAIIGTGLFYATYLLSARWFDVARIDSLYVFLILSALFVFVHYRGARAAIISGLLFTLAFFTKQNALIVALPLLLAGLLLSRRHTLMTAAVFALCLSVSLPIANHMSEGWFYYYVFEVPAAHRVDTRYYLDFWTKDLAANLWPLMLLLAASWGHVWQHDRRRALQYLALAAGLMAAAYGGRLHRYGWSNVLIPAHLCLALCTALTLAHWLRVGQHKQIIASLLLVLGQMALLLYNPVYFIPSHDDVRQGDAFMQKIAAIDGDVFMPGIQFVPTRIGKTSYSYGFAAIDVLLTRTSEHAHVRDNLRQELAGALAERRFSATVTSYLADRQQMEQYYDAVEQIDYPKMVAGFQPRPSWLMLPKKEN